GDVRLCAQATGDDVAVAVAARLLLGQESDAHLLGDPRVILRDLTQLAIADDIGAAVADVDDIGAATSEDERDTGRAHAGQFRMLARMTVDRVIRLIYSVGERVDDVFLWRGVVRVADGLGAEL